MDRRIITISGIVQGVGFRPFVFNLANRLRLQGFVKNQGGGVVIEVEGEPSILDSFLTQLASDFPPLARVDQIESRPCPPRGDGPFRITVSEDTGVAPVLISADVAVCDACLAEMFDPQDRRYRYPFLSCTHCGPRLTITQSAPFDRERTTLSGFPLCPPCRAEYEDPTNRRFHAQATACGVCGPHLWLADAQGKRVATADPLHDTAEALRAGRIVAIKGLGGYHLACDARRDDLVKELRRRKHRDEKPFAVMVTDLATARELALISPSEETLLCSSARPIVLLQRRPGALVAAAVSPGQLTIGLFLPYTPLHHLLLREPGTGCLVMTSGNRSDDPMAYEDESAIQNLGGIADCFLGHNRPIHLRCDDSVTRVVADTELPIRRSRGYAPRPVSLPVACDQPTVALGGQLKTVFALGRDRRALLSHHLGDLDHYEAYSAYTQAVSHYERLFNLAPEVLVHDLHADYASSRYAIERQAKEPGLARLTVQHHHAHMASCMAEHGIDEPVIGVTFDGTGMGTDEAIWGGEFLVGDYRQFRRAAHFRYVAMPGGERAIREPWRLALAHLLDAGLGPDLLRGSVPDSSLRIAGRMFNQEVNSPRTSSVGRLFDAVAVLARGRHQVSYEGQAAIELEGLVGEEHDDFGYPFVVSQGEPMVIDTRPLITAVVEDVRRRRNASLIARWFHTGLVELIRAVCLRLRKQTGLGIVVLSGGVFQNALLSAEATTRLEAEGFRVYRHHLVPCNDGGLCLGQLAIAACSTRDTRVPKGGS